MTARIHATIALAFALLLLVGSPTVAARGEVLGTVGPDLLRGTGDADRIDGLGGDDELRGRGGADQLFGRNGQDLLLGGGGGDLLHGGDASDRLRAGRGSDRLLGRGASDELFGEGGNDALVGGPGNDVVRPGPGADGVHLGPGHDLAALSADGRADRLDCGAGHDRVALGRRADPRDTFVDCEEVRGGDPAGRAFLTLHFGRTQWEQRDATCTTALPRSLTLLDVAKELRSRGLEAVGHTVVDRTSDTSERHCERRFAYATWDDLALLRDSYGWSFVSAGRTYANMRKLTPAEQRRESCGSLRAFTEHGHTRAHGVFAYPDNRFTVRIQADVVSSCFAYGRTYGNGVNHRHEMIAPHLQSTAAVNGGACHALKRPCSDLATHGGRRYKLPVRVAARMSPDADQWSAVQFYRFVVGRWNDPEDPSFGWDCTSTNAAHHWTSKAEIYCWKDFKRALDAISPNVIVTHPLHVARVWGHLP